MMAPARGRRAPLALSAVLLLAVLPTGLAAQVSILRATPAAPVAAAVVPVLKVSVIQGGTQHIPDLRDNARNPFPSPVRVKTEWQLGAGASSILLVAYFTSPSRALTDGTYNIPTSRIEGLVPQLGMWLPFTFTGSGAGVPGASFYFTLRDADDSPVGSRTDDLSLRINLTGMTVVPGTYSGTMYLRAVTQ